MALPTHPASRLALIAALTLVIHHCYRRGLRRPTLEPPVNDRSTYRIVGVPLDWDLEQLQTFLEDSKKAVPIIKSLSRDIDNSSKTATVIFQDLPLSPQTCQSERIPLPRPSNDQPASDQYLMLDKAFLGITTLFTPPAEDHKIDVVALSGLGGHAFGSFKERSGDHMWLRDSLPHDLTSEGTGQPMARIMTYGYESNVAHSENIQNIEDLGTMLRHSLLALTSASTMRPMILIAHSLGGLIVKQALMALSKSSNEDDQNFLQAIYGIVFFGVPHGGMNIESLLPMVGDGPNRFLVESISHINSQILTIQQREFHKALSDKDRSEVFCFYETLKSPTARKDKHGRWEMKGPSAVLVTKSSATHCRPWEDGAEHICAIARTHSNMVKFEPRDHEYTAVREKLQGLARRALNVRDRIQARTKFLVPYNENPNFVERSNVINILEKQLGLGQPQGASRPRTRVALFGLGGVGKTQVTLAYVYWVRHSFPDIPIFWVHASNADRFRQAYASIAQECDIPGRNDPMANLLLLVKTWLERTYKTRWLMVVDNADDIELFSGHQQEERSLETTTAAPTDHCVGRYIPECKHGSIIVTTRNKQVGLRLNQGKPPIEVDKMNDDEACLLYRGILEDDEISAEDISLLSSRLEHLPLALAQAAAFIQENGIPISEYIKLLDESDAALVNRLSEPFETVGRDSETPHAVTATWIISFNQIKRRNPFDSDILSFMSFFHWQAIPREFMEDYCRRKQEENEEADPFKAAILTKALGTLKAFSFISEDKDRNMNMHRLVQLVTRKWVDNKKAELVQLALKTISNIYPYGEYDTRDECLRLLPHAYAVLENDSGCTRDEKIARARLLHCMGGYFIDQGQWDVAEHHQKEATAIHREEGGESHKHALSSMSNLASIFRAQGRWEEAENLQVQVMEACKIKLGEDHPDTLTSMNNLAFIFQNQGRWEEAENLQMQVIEARKIKLGEDHPDTLTSMNNLASIFRGQGRWEEAENLQVQVMEARKIKLREDHPDTLTSMNNLAFIFQNQGRWEEAENLQVQVMEARKIKLGEDHPDTLTSMNNLALTFQNQGRWEEAENLQVQVMEASKIKLGEDHPDTLTSMNNLVLIFKNQGQWEEAENLQVQVMEACKIKLGEDHPDTLTSMNNLAFTYKDRGRDKEGLLLMEKCALARREVLGTKHPDTVSSFRTLEEWAN